MRTLQFHRIEGDHASYCLGDGAAALRLVRKYGTVAVDIETAGLEDLSWDVKAISIGTVDHAVVLDPKDPGQAAAARDAMAEATELLFHNAPFDVPILVVMGLMRAEDVWKVTDTLVEARLAFPGEHVPHNLGAACERYLGTGYGILKTRLEDGYKAITGRKKADMFRELGLSSPAYVAYAAFDIIMTARLHDAMPAAIAERMSNHPYPITPDVAYLSHREQMVNQVLLNRSCLGITIDFDVVDLLKGEMAAEVDQADRVLSEYAVDVDGTREKVKRSAIDRLDTLGELPVKHPRLKSGLASADARHLEKISHPVVEALKKRSQALRFADDYADKMVHLAHDGRIHPQVSVLAATTGRMSYGSPPIQQLPQRVRRMMAFDVPSTSMDWSSIEPVYFANVSGELDLVAEFEAGGDLYLPVAAAAGVDRKVAKTILLAQQYGQGIPALAGRLGVSEDEAVEIRDKVMGRMPKIRDAIKKIKAVGNTVGCVPTMSGRIVPLEKDYKTGNRSYFGYRGVNYVIQGSCYDLLAEVIVEVHRRGLADAVQVAVHDELVVATEVADEVQHIMETPPAAFIEQAERTPVLRVGRVDLGTYWMEKE